MQQIIIQGGEYSPLLVQEISRGLNSSAQIGNRFAVIDSTEPVSHADLETLRARYATDINILPAPFNPTQTKLLITDMDSTFINIECIDEIADFAGVKAQVSAITETAMRGELDFAGSLTKRVALLKDLDVSALERVYSERLQLNPGAETMLKHLRKRGIKIALVSGGFTFFTSRLDARVKLDFTLANELDIVANKLTGKVRGDIVGAERKALFLSQLVEEMQLDFGQTVAMGDGANDLKMMALAGLSVAYHAKPKVQSQAATALNHCGLEGVLGLLQIDF